MTSLYTIISALIPVFAMIAMGYGFKRTGFPGAEFWPLADKLTYYVLFPALLISKIGTATLPQTELRAAAVSIIALLLLGTLFMALLAIVTEKNSAARTSMLQGGIRFNTYVGLAAATAIYGDTGLLWGAVFLTLMIPLVNVICVAGFAFFIPSQHVSLGKHITGALIRNPLIIACLVGAGINLLNIPMHALLLDTLTLISNMALPLGLLSVGTSLSLRVLTRLTPDLWVSTLFKLLAYPLLFLGLAHLLNLSQDATLVILLFATLPTAPSAYILSKQLGGDSQLMAATITLQTLLAIFSMSFWLTLGTELI